jgi:integrase
LIFRRGLRVSEACDLRCDDIDLSKRTIIVRRLKGSTDSSHYLEKDEHRALGDLWRSYAKKGIKSAYVFVNERNQPFGRMGIARIIERAGEARSMCTCCDIRRGTPWPVAEWTPGASSTISGMPQSRIRCVTRQCRLNRSKTSGADRFAGERTTGTIQACLGHKSIQHTARYTELAPTRFKSLFRD